MTRSDSLGHLERRASTPTRRRQRIHFLLRALGLVGAPSTRSRFDARRAELFAAHMAIDALGKLDQERLGHEDVARALCSEYEARSNDIGAEVAQL